MGKPYRNLGPCSYDWCDRPAASMGKCRTCYGRDWAAQKVASDPDAAERKRAANRKWAANREPNSITVTEKRCGSCQETKSASEFHRQLRGTDGLQAVCKRCSTAGQEAYALTRRCRKVGITVEQYHKLMEQQGGMCGTCKRRPATDLDHCHRTDKFRGLVCAACNRILGTVDDDAALLRLLADYIDSAGLPLPA